MVYRPEKPSKRGAVLRIVLGRLQVIGATVAVSLLVTLGVSPLTVGVAAVTLFLTPLSKSLFRHEA
jgi:hypothetical protein